MKNKNFSKILSFVIALALGFSSAPMVTYGAQDENGIKDGYAWDESEVLSNAVSETGEKAEGIPDSAVLTYRDMPSIDTGFSGEDASLNPAKGVLPASYSSASNIPSSISVSQKGNYITSVKNQGSYGTCWAHSAINGAESGYIKSNGLTASTSEIDWNEYHLVYYFWNTPDDPLGLFGGDYVYNSSGSGDLMVGGNSILTLFAYANWIGASDDPYFGSYDVLNKTHYDDTDFAFDAAAHLENGYLLTMPDMYSDDYQADMDVIKQMVMDYGSVDIAYFAYHGSPYWKNNAYQYYDESTSTNHAVSIVGWSDDIPATAFGIQAPGNGAWLVKNSWGTGWGQSGYFWLSYYDKTIHKNAFVYDFADADTYDNNYQYDGGVIPFYGYSRANTVTGANAFIADSDETVQAVGFYTGDVNVGYEIRVYKNLTENAIPTEGTLVHTQSGMQTYAGFHTVELTKDIGVLQGERYAIVVTLIKDGSYVRMLADRTQYGGWYETYSFAKSGESYLGSTIDTLRDLNADNDTHRDGENVRIKAFTDEGLTDADDPYADVPTGVYMHTDGNWYFFRNGQIDFSYNGLAKNEMGIWYIANGKVDFGVNNVAFCGKNWYYFQNGALCRVHTVAPTPDGNWWCITDGMVNFGYTGLASNDAGWWYIENGMVNFGYTGLTEYYGTWYYVENGGLNWNYTGLTYYYGTWYYVENGSLNWNYTGLVYHYGTWYYVENGSLNWNYTGLTYYYGTWYYVENGSLNWNYTGLTLYYGTWYYVGSGVLDWSYTGNALYNGTWWYVENGILVGPA